MMENIQHKKRIRLKGFDYSGCFRYFLTFCTKDKAAYFNNAVLVSGIADFLHEAAEKHGFKIWSFCFMPDHLHVLVEGEKQTSDLKKFASLFKQKTGYWFRHYSNKGVFVGQGFSLAENQAVDLWQINYYEHVLRSDEATESVARYILDNPVRKGMVEDYRSYPFSWCDIFGFAGQGFSLAENVGNAATLKGCPTEETSNNPKGLPYKSAFMTPNAHGFTLIEAVITIVLVGILSGLAALIILQGVRAYSDEQSRGDMHYQVGLAMERMGRELRQVRSCGAPDLPGMVNPSASITFTDINNAAITFSRTGTDLMRGADVLAKNITALQFRFLDINGNQTVICGPAPTNAWLIEISLTATDPGTAEAIAMRTRVHPRNF